MLEPGDKIIQIAGVHYDEEALLFGLANSGRLYILSARQGTLEWELKLAEADSLTERLQRALETIGERPQNSEGPPEAGSPKP